MTLSSSVFLTDSLPVLWPISNSPINFPELVPVILINHSYSLLYNSLVSLPKMLCFYFFHIYLLFCFNISFFLYIYNLCILNISTIYYLHPKTENCPLSLSFQKNFIFHRLASPFFSCYSEIVWKAVCFSIIHGIRRTIQFITKNMAGISVCKEYVFCETSLFCCLKLC